MRRISFSKASTFQSRGFETSSDSYVVLAEISLTSSRAHASVGMNFAQLSSIQPRSALVTSTTWPCRLAAMIVSRALSATSWSCSHCSGVTSQLSSRRSPWLCTHVDGSTVSSQSKMKTVSSSEKGSAWCSAFPALLSGSSSSSAGATGEVQLSPGGIGGWSPGPRAGGCGPIWGAPASAALGPTSQGASGGGPIRGMAASAAH
mmetsp:Transcript_67681/g.192049  ORF Transcript_67681/g.192049 Transcript_67681/m.192049 type:complete len:204 (+) Transcript_67681:170-781(+)